MTAATLRIEDIPLELIQEIRANILKNLRTEDIPDPLFAGILEQALEFRRQHKGRIHVVKASGKIVDNPDIRRAFAKQVVSMRRDLGLKVVVVHGAGRQIDVALTAAGFESKKKDGLRITNADHVDIIDGVAMETNRILCEAFIEAAGSRVDPVGLAGYDPVLQIFSAPVDAQNDNFSGNAVMRADTRYLRALLDDNRSIPIVTNMCGVKNPVGGVDKINVNADPVAAALAISLGAYRLLMCSDVAGVLDANGDVIPEIRLEDMQDLIAAGVLQGGMLVKVKEAFATASRMGPDSGVVIMDEKFLVELLTRKGHGTMVRAPNPAI